MKNVISVNATLLGAFQLITENAKLDESDLSSEKATKLLTYLISHHNAPVSQQELCEAIWEEAENDNPLGAIKNMVYRVRIILKKTFGDVEMITSGRGYYKWNDGVNIIVDVEQFENLCLEAEQETDISKRIDKRMEAYRMYGGKLLENYADQYWLISRGTYYHSVYLKLMEALYNDLMAQQRYEELEMICQDAIEIDELDENLHYYYIQSLIGQKKIAIAKRCYDETCALLNAKLGVSPTERFRSLYDEFMKEEHGLELNLESIKNEVYHRMEKDSVYFCEYGIFVKNCELELRRAQRSGHKVFLGLITVDTMYAYAEYACQNQELLAKGILEVKAILERTLRHCDVISQYSAAQLIIMLPVSSESAAKLCMDRVRNMIDKHTAKFGIRVKYSLEEMK